MIKLRNLLEIAPAEKAKKMGLTYAGWGAWEDKGGKTVARTVAGKLVMLKAKKQVSIMQKKIGQQKGTNEGGTYLGSDGIKRYVKFYPNPDKAYGEHVANSIYNMLGIKAPQSQIFSDGKRVGYASKIIPNKGELQHMPRNARKQLARKILNGFAADVLMANWDAIGFDDDNIVIGKDNQPIRIDNGGALLYRGRADEKKDPHLLNKIDEWDGLTDPNINSNYANVFRDAGYRSAKEIPNIKQQVASLVKLYKREGGFPKLISKLAPHMSKSDSKKLSQMLTSRLKLLVQKVKPL